MTGKYDKVVSWHQPLIPRPNNLIKASLP